MSFQASQEISNERLNVATYRINEFQPKTPRITSQKHGVDAVLTVVSNVDPSLLELCLDHSSKISTIWEILTSPILSLDHY